MSKHLTAVLIALTLMTAGSLAAQWNIEFAAVRGGIINASYLDRESFYPEVQIGGMFGLPAFEWSCYWARWEKEAYPNVMDAVEYSYAAHVFGARIALYPVRATERWPVPIAVWGGFARHFIHRAYAYGSDGLGTVPTSGEEPISTMEAGVKLYVPLGSRLEASAEIHKYFGIGNTRPERDRVDTRAASIGLAMRF
jgi:hypothetical protein